MSMSKFATVAEHYAHIEKVNAELLEALEGCVLAWQREAALYSMMNAEDKQEPPYIMKARAAIAKARGGK